MAKRFGIYAILVLVAVSLFAAGSTEAQLGNSGSIEGTVKDPSGGAVPGATVEIRYGVSGFVRTTTTGADGTFHFTNVPFNPYHLTVTASGFAPYTQDVDVRSAVATNVEVALKIGTEATTVNVTENGGDLIETESTFHGYRSRIV